MSVFTQTGISLSEVDRVTGEAVDATIEAALQLIEDPQWREKKVISQTQDASNNGSPSKNKIKHEVRTSKLAHRHGEKLNWFKRSSVHPVGRDLKYEEFRTYLLENHTPNEQKYIPDLKEYECLKVVDKGTVEVYHMMYHTPFPATNRDFAELVITKELSSQVGTRSFVVIQVPVSGLPERKGYARAGYTSVEVISERMSQDGVLEILWRMALASSAGGKIPQPITDASLPGQVAHDVPSFIAWTQKQRST